MLKQSVNLLIVLVFAVCFRAGADESLISTNTTVVLVSGLPGDAESESAFHDQLQAWLGVVAKQHPEKCIVLCDSAEGAALPNLRPIKPDRDHFLELPLRVGSNASAVTVIIWGHGGQQGNAPVFHVRGPRITPEDVSAVCSKLPTANSQWLLMFKGSGAFGKALAGLGRQILSSDNSRALGSDPVSLPLLARIVQQTPGITLKQLAQKVGPAVADWYAQRNLAQTEEPTLWLGAEEPRSVALGGAEPQLTTGGPELGAEKPLSTSSRENGLKPEEPDSSADGFSQIQKVKPEQYPDADAVVLESRQICSLGTTPALVNEREEFIQVLKPEGKRYGDFDVLFSPPSEELEFLICEVLRPDGQVIRMDPQAAGISGERSLGDFQAPRRKFFSLPSVTVGAVLHVRYRSEWREYPLPRISMELPVGKELPVAKSTLEVRVPAELPFHYKIVDLPEVAPAVSRSAYSVRYSWQWQNVPADLMEPLAPPHRHAGLSVSTYRDWREFADWYGHISRLADEVGPELAQKALELTRDASSEREKVENIYRYVTGLRYVAIPLGINSVRPHAAARVLQSQFGDCKDKANLLNSLLHAIDVKADLVLVPRFKQAYEDLPGFAFNHAISRVLLGKEVLWLDSTDEACRFGLLPPGDAGRNVMVLNEGSEGLTRLPFPRAGEHRLTIRGEVTPDNDCKSCVLSLSASASGSVDYQLRNEAREMRSVSTSPMALLSGRYHPVNGTFAMGHQAASSPSAMTSDFQWHADGTYSGAVSQMADLHVVHAPFWLPKEWDVALGSRKAPLFLNEGYPLALDEEFKICVPWQDQRWALPEPSGNELGPLKWNVSWTRLNDGNLVGRLRAELRTGELSKDEAAEFQRQMGELLGVLASDVISFRSSVISQR